MCLLWRRRQHRLRIDDFGNPIDGLPAEGEEEWLKFDDDKVSVVKRDKILALEGGGEDSVAYVLLYRCACYFLAFFEGMGC